nr:hypothetical protein [Tanacetum cinerariifolium]
MASSSAPQLDYAPVVQHSSEYSPPETGLVVLSNTESTSDSNIISYSQYMNESQYNTVQNLTLPTLQDDLILSVIKQLKTQVVNCTKINQDNKHVNELLTAELERYKNQERVLNELKHDDKASTSYEPSTLSKHLKEKESLEQKITILKNDFQKEESRNIDRELALEKQALGFQNPCYLKKAKQLKPKLYDGHIIEKYDAVVIHDTEKRLMLAEESRSKMIEKQNDPQMTEKKELPKVSMVNSCLKKIKFHLASFDMVVKKRTTATAITEAQAQAKDTVISKLKEKLRSLNGDVTERNVKREFEEIETLNIELDHK